MKDIPVASLLPIVFGVLIILIPSLLAYLIGIYLIVTGVLNFKKR